MSLLSLGIGVVFLVAGVYQLVDPRLGGLRLVGIIDSSVDVSADEVSNAESVFGYLVGVGLLLVGVFFLGLYAIGALYG